MTDAELAAVEAAVARALAPVEQRLGDRIDGVEHRIDGVEQRLGARMDQIEQRMTGVMTGAQQLFRELSERMAQVETRVGVLTAAFNEAWGHLSGRMLALELELATVRGRLDRLSADITRGRTIDIEQLADIKAAHAEFERRLGVLEAAQREAH